MSAGRQRCLARARSASMRALAPILAQLATVFPQFPLILA
jgi:hypothetical protein